MLKDLIYYLSNQGKSPFLNWLEGLKDKKARAIIKVRLDRIRRGNFGDCKPIGHGIEELRIHYGSGYRVYFGRDGHTIVVLLCGGIKGSQKRDIKKAKIYWEDYWEANYEKKKR